MNRRWNGEVPMHSEGYQWEPFVKGYIEAMNSETVWEMHRALKRIAGMPCLTALLGESGREDSCGCAACQAAEALAAYEKDLAAEPNQGHEPAPACGS